MLSPLFISLVYEDAESFREESISGSGPGFGCISPAKNRSILVSDVKVAPCKMNASVDRRITDINMAKICLVNVLFRSNFIWFGVNLCFVSRVKRHMFMVDSNDVFMLSALTVDCARKSMVANMSQTSGFE